MWTQAQYDNLADAISKGLLEVNFDGRKVVYQNLGEMRALLAEMRSQISSGTSGFGTVYASYVRD